MAADKATINVGDISTELQEISREEVMMQNGVIIISLF